MEEPPPQDDDPNFSALNPRRSPLLSRDLIFEGLFFKNWGEQEFGQYVKIAGKLKKRKE